jgi:hypothetical protein
LTAFAYPVGNRDSFNADTRQVLKEVGVRYAFSYYGGFQGTATGDDYDIRREPIEPYVAPALFEGIFGLPTVFCTGEGRSNFQHNSRVCRWTVLLHCRQASPRNINRHFGSPTCRID